MTLPLSLDYALAMADGIGERGGVTDAELEELRPDVERAVRRVTEKVDAGELGFWNLPQDRQTLERIDTWVAGVDDTITDVLVLGIGGSSLGTRALMTALAGPAELFHTRPRRVHLPDNSDPWVFSSLLNHLTPASTMAVVISKSGGTVETAAQMLVVRAWLAAELGDRATEHIVFVTDPERGSLRALAAREGIEAFSVPANVGGRFSVLTAVGLLPARLMGLAADALLEGAAEMAHACRRPELATNPAALIAALSVLHHRRRDHHLHVLMPYSDALRPFAAWYVQLWAESLGKRHDRHGVVVEVGPTPIPAVGATDQHAQMQLFMEGPRDKLVTFIAVDQPLTDLEVPAADGDFAWVGGHRMAHILDAERRGTALALAEDGRPSLTLTLERVDARSLGALFFVFEAATAFAGELYGIDAFNQPGVELGKRLASGLLGRPGFESAAARVGELEGARPTRYRCAE